MELKHYLQIAVRWAWLLILGAALGAAGGYYYSKGQQPVYQANTRAMLMRAPLEQSSDLTYYSDLQLVQTYLQLMTTQPVLDKASEQLGYKVSKGQIKVKQNQDTQIMDLTVEDSNPQHAADIANVLIQVLIEHNTNLQSGRYLATEESLTAQIDTVEGQIKSIQSDVDQISNQNFQDQLTQTQAQITPLQDEVSTLQQEIAALNTPKTTEAQRTQIAEKQARIDQLKPLLDLYQQIYSNLVVLGKPVDAGSQQQSSRMTQLQSTLDLYQQLYLNLLSSRETIRLARLQNTPDIVQIEQAAVPGGPIRPRPLMNAALGAMVGLMLAAGTVFLVEYLDDTLKTPEDVERLLGVPVLGFVADMRVSRKNADDIFILRQPRSPVAEAFRSLRTNVDYSATERPVRTLLVTSTGPSEGKTTIAANLAATFSQSKKRVVLVDADLRRPKIHRLFGLANRKGLSNLFAEGGERIENVGRVRKDLPNLMVIPSGDPPPNPAELLSTTRMGQLLDQLARHVDIVVIDTPPSLVADAQILAARVDAILFVIQPGVTRANMALAAMDSFRRSGARVIGVVMNRIPKNRPYYYGGYKYYSTYGSNKHYYSSAEPKPVAAGSNGHSSSILQSLPKAAGEAGARPVQAQAREVSSPTGMTIHEPIKLNLDQSGNKGKNNFDVMEEDDQHPSVEKLFADLTAPPPRNPSNHRNNGHS